MLACALGCAADAETRLRSAVEDARPEFCSDHPTPAQLPAHPARSPRRPRLLSADPVFELIWWGRAHRRQPFARAIRRAVTGGQADRIGRASTPPRPLLGPRRLGIRPPRGRARPGRPVRTNRRLIDGLATSQNRPAVDGCPKTGKRSRPLIWLGRQGSGLGTVARQETGSCAQGWQGGVERASGVERGRGGVARGGEGVSLAWRWGGKEGPRGAAGAQGRGFADERVARQPGQRRTRSSLARWLRRLQAGKRTVAESLDRLSTAASWPGFATRRAGAAGGPSTGSPRGRRPDIASLGSPRPRRELDAT